MYAGEERERERLVSNEDECRAAFKSIEKRESVRIERERKKMGPSKMERISGWFSDPKNGTTL